MDNCLVYVAKGSGKVSGADVAQHNVVRMAAEDPAVRDLELSSGPDVMRVLVFAGKRLRQPIGEWLQQAIAAVCSWLLDVPAICLQLPMAVV